MKPYRVIHFVSYGSGSTNVAIDLALGHQSGPFFEPILVFRSHGADPAVLQKLRNAGIPVIELPWNPKSEIVMQLISIIKEYQPQIFVAHGYREHIFGRIAAVKAKVPVIFHVEHNTEKYELHRYFMARYLTLFTAKIICVSHGVKNHLIKLGFNHHKLNVIYNGIPTERFFETAVRHPFKDRSADVVMAARFCRQKDHLTLIRATKFLQAQGIQCQILLAGDGQSKYLKQCKQLCEKLGVQSQVHFLGQVERDSIPTLFSHNKVFVLSTFYEGLGLVVLEAMASGCAVVASHAVGVSELIQDNKTGFLVPKQDPETLAAKIRFLLENEVTAQQIATAGQDFVKQQFQVERMVQEYETLFLDELNKKSLLINSGQLPVRDTSAFM